MPMNIVEKFARMKVVIPDQLKRNLHQQPTDNMSAQTKNQPIPYLKLRYETNTHSTNRS